MAGAVAPPVTHYRTKVVDGVTIFYREADRPEAPAVLLLLQGATPCLRDLPDADLHLLDTGHFALEDKLDVMAPLILGFLDQATART